MEERGIYLGKMVIRPDVITIGDVSKGLTRERSDALEGEEYLKRNLTKYGVDRTLLVPKDECDGCSNNRDRKYSHFGLMPDGTIVTLGSECAKRLLTRHCHVCDTKYDFDNGKSTYLHCTNCKQMKFDYGLLSGKTYGHIRRKLISEHKEWYNTYCESIVYGNPDSKFRLYLINECGYDPDKSEYPVKYYTSGYFTNCNVYYVNKLLRNKKDAQDVDSIDRKVGNHCDYCNRDYLYEISSEKYGKTCVYLYVRGCSECREYVKQHSSDTLVHGINKGRNFGHILSVDMNYVIAHWLQGNTDYEFTTFSKRAVASGLISQWALDNANTDESINRRCNSCALPTEPSLMASDNYCIGDEACERSRIRLFGEDGIMQGKHRGKAVAAYVGKCKGISRNGNDSFVRKYVKFLVANGHTDGSYRDIITYHDATCRYCKDSLLGQ